MFGVLGVWVLLFSFAFIPPAAGQNTSTYPAILNTSYKLLQSHYLHGRRWGKPYHFYRPANTKYSNSQWLWDSGSHMIVWSHRSMHAMKQTLKWFRIQFRGRNLLDSKNPSNFIWQAACNRFPRNVTNAVLDLRTMLSMQKTSGFIPVNNPPNSATRMYILFIL